MENEARCRIARRRRKNGHWDYAALRVMVEQHAEEVPRLIRDGLASEGQDFCAAVYMTRHAEGSWCGEVFDAFIWQ